LIPLQWPDAGSISWPVAVSHRLMVLSHCPAEERTLASGENAKAVMPKEWACQRRTSLPVWASHRRMVPSPAPPRTPAEARTLPSREKATVRIVASSPWNRCNTLPDSTSHKQIARSTLSGSKESWENFDDYHWLMTQSLSKALVL